ncbi:MAG: DUF4157 domain-containing protein [Nitrososphaera sp.]|nr:DUF4157 domain-containing protein [Nitrososphaera sp.]
MRDRKLKAIEPNQSYLSLQPEENKIQMSEAQDLLSPQRNPLVGMTSRVGNETSIKAHVVRLNQATNGQPARARHSLLRLQRQFGNRYVQRTVAQIKKHDSEESVSVNLQRQCACGGVPGPTGECAQCHQKRLALHRRAHLEGETSKIPPIVYEVLRSPGQSLNASTRSGMEERLGHDFSQVRVHTDTKAAESAEAIDALAYTVGRDVVFGAGQYAPNAPIGRKLLAHELTHVIQQSPIVHTQPNTLELDTLGNIYEQEAEAVATQVTRGNNIVEQLSFSNLPIHRLQRQRRQDTHAGLFEMTRHNPLGGPTFAPQAQYDARIEFLPYRIVDCDQIAMVQTVVSSVGGSLAYGSAARRSRSLTAAEGTEGLGIDRLSGRSLPYYGTTNAGTTGGNAHFGSRTGTNRPDRAWMEDAPGFPGTAASNRTAGQTLSQHFETCAICIQGTDEDAYYGCVSWGFDIDASNNFTEAPFERVSKGTPSGDFLAAARKWNAQTTPVATTDLPIPGHTTRNEHMTLSELNTEIRSLETTLRGLAPGDADVPQITFELRVLRDIRDAIEYNEDQGYLTPVIEMIQAKVGARPDGIWGYDTVRRVKIWQARNGLVTDGRVGSRTLERMGIHRAGDYPLPDTSPTATRVA